jgi:hypothetical protein
VFFVNGVPVLVVETKRATAKETLDRHLPPEYSRVEISQAGKKDREILKKH